MLRNDASTGEPMNVVLYHRTLRIARNRGFGLRLAFATPGVKRCVLVVAAPGSRTA